MTVRAARVVLSLSVLLALATTVRAQGVRPPADAGYKLTPGPWAVAVADRVVVKDQRRRRNIELAVRYPSVKATRARPLFPLIVFCRGTEPGGDLPDLAAHWASYGYVVISPGREDLRPPARRSIEREPFDLRQRNRLADVQSILDGLDQVVKKMDGFHGRRAAHVDGERIGIAGYSTGALTAQMAVGVKVRVTSSSGEPELRSVGDARVKAAVLISGQGTINRMLTRESWSDLAKPLLVITGSRDVVATSRETPDSRQEPFEMARPGQKFLLFIDGATHTSYSTALFADRGVSAMLRTPDAEVRMAASATAATTLAFWDAFLENDPRGHEYLASDDVAKLTGGKAQLKRR